MEVQWKGELTRSRRSRRSRLAGAVLTFFFRRPNRGCGILVGIEEGQELSRGRETEVRYDCLSGAARLLNVSLVRLLIYCARRGSEL